jgi:hypothetical protein
MMNTGPCSGQPFEALTGLKAFVVANALTDIGAPKELISPLVQHLPKLWELVHHYGMTTLELNPIRMRPGREGRLTPVACDFKCGFDRDDSRWERLGFPDHLFTLDASDFEREVNQLRTYQGQSDVFVINDKGTILAPTFGGGANSLVSLRIGVTLPFAPAAKTRTAGWLLCPVVPNEPFLIRLARLIYQVSCASPRTPPAIPRRSLAARRYFRRRLSLPRIPPEGICLSRILELVSSVQGMTALPRLQRRSGTMQLPPFRSKRIGSARTALPMIPRPGPT